MFLPSRLYAQAFVLLSSFLIHPLTTPHAAAQAAAVTGHVLDPAGRPVANATVTAETGAAAALVVSSDARGGFEVPVAAGPIRLRASAPGLASADELVLPAGQSGPVTLRLRLVALDEHLVVTATQVASPLSRLPDSTTVLSGDTLEARQQFGASQALRSVPGLTVQQTGGPGAQTSLFMRGGESDYTLVLIDGIRANALGGGIDLSQVPLADVERVEVVRGPQSALYGGDAIGGVVQIITRVGGRPSGQALGELGSRSMRRGAASTIGELGGFRWQAGGDHFEEAGFTGLASNGEAVTNDDARISQGALTLGWRAAAGVDLQGHLRYVDTDRGTPGAVGADPAGRFSGVARTARNLTARWTGGARVVQPWFGVNSRVRQRTEVDVADLDLTARSAFPSEGETRRTHLRTQTDIAAGAALGLTGGVEWIGERGSSTFITANGVPTPLERSMLGVFGEARWSPLARLSMSAGARVERIRRDAYPGDPAAFTPRPDFPTDTVVSVNPKLTASWMVAGDPTTTRRWTRLHGAAGTGIRPPDAFEMAFTDNSGLAPERSRSLDVGVAQVLAGGAVQVDVTAFANEYDDLIVAVGRTFSGASRWRTDNISNARARGLETSAAWRPVANLSLAGAYTWLSTEILAVDGSPAAPPPYRVGDRLLRRPRHQGSLDATWTRGRTGAFAQLLWRGQTLDAEPAFGPTGGLYDNPGYTLANGGLSLRIVPGVTITGRVLNLLGRRYEEVLGFPAPGRTAYVGVRLATSR